ncbi:hypothetical protein DTO166G4_4942 [Paecilomyces variotii]|nr:hypothetical protein DTO166G4_4942 [Paecilomyces variotii]KAJ9233516.1 hypothetical protein DTO166G5_5639 [Paecilomyces variotii]KAJ9255593.1 hypothetical protein DTO207G8_2983 [Paecilomyces variotii]
MLITASEILNPSIANLPSKATVIKLCKKKGFRHNHITYSTDDKDIFIKYNNASMDEAHTQLFFYEQIMKKRDSVIRIPEIYHAFETELGLTYILMEHIDIKDKASDEQIAQAVSELISIPPPAGVFGSISGGRIRHFFFRDREAPFHFSSAFELADFINGTLSCVRKVQREPDNDKVDFSNEPLMCYYSDLHRDNFPVDSNGQLWVVDFQQAGVLPSSFMTFALHSSRQRRLPLPIRKTIPVPETSNLKLISYVSYILQISWNMYTPGESIS